MKNAALWAAPLAGALLLCAGALVAMNLLRPAAVSGPLHEPEHLPLPAAPQKPLDDFTLTASDGLPFDTQQLRGQVWVASFFFSSCPSICRQQNEIVRRLCRQYGPRDVRFVSITCDPEVDTPERLTDYARLFEADPEQWLFLTGDLDEISRIGEQNFQLGVGYRTHSDRFVTVDKWGFVRGVYDWHDARQLEDLDLQLEQLLGESASPQALPPAAAADDTAGGEDAGGESWLRDFRLTASSGQPFDSRQLDGQVWVASFFFTTCASTCRAQNDAISHLAREFGSQGVQFVCISCDPETDTPERLKDYARLYDADPEQWSFLTGDLATIRRIGAERFGVPVDLRAHVDRLIVVDQAGEVRGKFDWQDAAETARLRELLVRLQVKQ